MRRTLFIFLLFVLVFGPVSYRLFSAEVIDPSRAKADAAGELLWYDIALLEMEGQGWKETKAPYDRLPARAEALVRAPVWNLSRNSAGLCVRFETDATAIHGRWTLTSGQLALHRTFDGFPYPLSITLVIYYLSASGCS